MRWWLWVICGMAFCQESRVFAINSNDLQERIFQPAIDLSQAMAPPRHQGFYRNTCAAFTATALAEFLIQKNATVAASLSPAFTHWSARRRALGDPFLRQMYSHTDGVAGFLAVESLERDGVVLERLWPYETLGPQPPQGLQLSPYWFKAEFVSRDAIADFLKDQQRPVAVNLLWYTDTVSPQGKLELPSVQQQQLCLQRHWHCQGHVVLIVGYNPTTKEFRFRNSWGSSWGDGGYGTMPEQYLMDHCEVCHLLSQMERFSPQQREFLKKAALGISARLLNR